MHGMLSRSSNAEAGCLQPVLIICVFACMALQDPDAPSPDHPKFRFFLHWLVINIPALDVKRGEVVTPYMGPVSSTYTNFIPLLLSLLLHAWRAPGEAAPVVADACPFAPLQSPPKGKHRDVFLLYKQHGRVGASNPKSRANWTLHQFAQVSLLSFLSRQMRLFLTRACPQSACISACMWRAAGSVPQAPHIMRAL